MSQRPAFYAFSGGMDETTQALAVPKGRVIACKNHEAVDRGYGRSAGYERYDGRPSPTQVFNQATSSTAAALRDAARAAIQRVPGSGAILGVACFEGQRYAWRNNVGATAAVMWRATAAGWVAVSMGASLSFTSGGTYEIVPGDLIVGATSAATATVKRVVITSGALADGTAAGYLVVTPVSGVFGAEVLKVGANNDVATIAAPAAAQSFPPNGRYFTINHNFYGASDRKEMYGVNGVGRGFAFDGDSVVFIGTGMVIDAPVRVTEYKQQLFFAFPGGSVQHSEPGEPLNWNPRLGAGEIAVGSDVTDFVSSVNALHIGTVDSINTLTGNDEQDFVLQPLTSEEGTGIIPFTAQTMGEPIYLDAGGLRGISATQAYGNFRRGALVNQIMRTFENKRKANISPVASVRVKNKDHYRLFFSDGAGVSVYFGRKYPEPMTFDLGRVVRCITTETSVAGGERVFFGSDDGFVYEHEVGTSYDGQPIESYLQLPYDHEGSPWLLKRWHKAILELEAGPATQIGMTAEFDYADGEQRSHPSQQFNVEGGGGLWDVATWNDFYWSSPAEGRAECYLDGQGTNMSLIIVSRSADQVGYILQGITKMVSVRGQKR